MLRAQAAAAPLLLLALLLPSRPGEAGTLLEDATAASGLPAVRFGEGVNLVDLDGDGLPELFLPCVKGPNRLFRNLGGGRFAEVTAELGPFGRNGIGAVVADLGGDPRPEIVVVSGAWPSGEVLLFTPGDGGRYEERAAAAGIAGSGNGIMPAVADVDRDGDLDLFVTVWGGDRFYRNAGGRGGLLLREESAAAGLGGPGRSWGATFADFTGDGLPDLFVARGGPGRRDPSRLYVGAPGGAFADGTAGTDLAAGGWQMGGVPFDADGDGDLDLFVTSFDGPDRLYRNDGRGGLRDATADAGIRSSRSVGAAAGDVDGDLLPDLVVAGFAGGVRAWRNTGGGRFEEATAAWGLGGTAPRNEGIALADVDGDGDLDLYVTNYDGANRLFLNRRAARPAVRVGAAGLPAPAVGACATLRGPAGEGERAQVAPLVCSPGGFGFCSQGPVELVFATGAGRFRVEPVPTGGAGSVEITAR